MFVINIKKLGESILTYRWPLLTSILLTVCVQRPPWLLDPFLESWLSLLAAILITFLSFSFTHLVLKHISAWCCLRTYIIFRMQMKLFLTLLQFSSFFFSWMINKEVGNTIWNWSIIIKHQKYHIPRKRTKCYLAFLFSYYCQFVGLFMKTTSMFIMWYFNSYTFFVAHFLEFLLLIFQRYTFIPTGAKTFFFVAAPDWQRHDK